MVCEGISIPSPNYPVLCFPLPYRVAPVFVQVVSPPLGWSPLSYFIVIWSQSGDTRGPSVVFEAVDMPYPGPFHFSYSVDYIYDFCPFPGLDVGLSIFVCDVEHTSFHFGLCFRKFVLCLFGQCPGLYTIRHSTQELYTCLVRHVAMYHSFQNLTRRPTSNMVHVEYFTEHGCSFCSHRAKEKQIEQTIHECVAHPNPNGYETKRRPQSDAIIHG